MCVCMCVRVCARVRACVRVCVCWFAIYIYSCYAPCIADIALQLGKDIGFALKDMHEMFDNLKYRVLYL